MKTRIKEVRKDAGLNQTEFGKRVGVTLSAEQKWELGISVPSDSAIMNICREFNISEIWLRTGAGEMHGDEVRIRELSDLVQSRLQDQPESFQAALIAALLRFDPDGPEWEILEKIYRDIAKSLGE